MNAQAQLATELAELRNSAPFSEGLAAVEGQLAALASVQQRLATGTVPAAALRSEIAASVSASATAIQQAKASASGDRAERVGLDAARAQAQATVEDFTDAYYGRRIFDPYLRFASSEEEDAYRRREEDRRIAIEAARAEGTPEGDLRAAQLAREQLLDAGAHGADASPEYQPMMDRLDRTIANLEPVVAQDRQRAEAPSLPAPDPFDSIEASPTDPTVIAAFQATGVVVADPSQTGHGVTATTPSGPAQGRV